MYILWVAWAWLYLFPQPSHMDVHGADIAAVHGLVAPHIGQQRFPAVYLVGIAHQKFQQVKFLGCQVNLPLSYEYPAAFRVHLKVPLTNDAIVGLFFFQAPVLGAAPYDCLNPGLDFQDIKGLAYIVIRPILQSKNLIHVPALSGQHDNRHVGKLPDGLADLITVQFWKHHIQKDDIVLCLFSQFHCLLAVICTIHFHAILFQAEADTFYN